MRNKRVDRGSILMLIKQQAREVKRRLTAAGITEAATTAAAVAAATIADDRRQMG